MGTGGRPPLDNVSVLDRYERQAADWSAEVGGSVVELHAYALTAPDDGLREHASGPPTRTLSRNGKARTSSVNGCCAATIVRDSGRVTSAADPQSTHPMTA